MAHQDRAQDILAPICSFSYDEIPTRRQLETSASRPLTVGCSVWKTYNWIRSLEKRETEQFTASGHHTPDAEKIHRWSLVLLRLMAMLLVLSPQRDVIVKDIEEVTMAEHQTGPNGPFQALIALALDVFEVIQSCEYFFS